MQMKEYQAGVQRVALRQMRVHRFELVKVGAMSDGRIPLYVVVDIDRHVAVTQRDTFTITDNICNSLNNGNGWRYSECDEVADAILKSQAVISHPTPLL